MTYVIGLPNGKRVTIATYIAAFNKLKVLPPESDVRGWKWHSVKARDVISEMRAGIHRRINKHVPGFGKGRKWCHDWQRTTRQFADAVNTPRLIVRWAPFEFRTRLAHRLYSDD